MEAVEKRLRQEMELAAEKHKAALDKELTELKKGNTNKLGVPGLISLKH